MDDRKPPLEVRQHIRDLMGKATLQRVRGKPGEALQLAQQALTLDETSWETHEFVGDMLLALGRGADALKSFQRARELNPSRVELEDKVARAAVDNAARLRTMEHAQALLEGRMPQEPKRKPAYAALLSLLAPGLGQLYNGHYPKGLALLAGSLLFVLLAIRAMMEEAAVLGAVHQSPVLALMGAGSMWLIVSGVLWIYAVADAAICAARTSTSDHTGIV